MLQILISACLIGENCKWDGSNNRNQDVLNFMKKMEGKAKFHPVCPEQAGGLPTPRAASEEGRKTQKAREDAAKERIFSILPEDQKNELIALFDEFEDCETSESKYAHAMDNLQPLLLNHSNNGDDWKQHQITSKQVYDRQSKTKLGSERLYEITDHLIQDAIKKGFVKE